MRIAHRAPRSQWVPWCQWVPPFDSMQFNAIWCVHCFSMQFNAIQCYSDLLRQCLRAHGGSFDPSCISHKAMGYERGKEPAWSRLNKLLQPGQQKRFIEGHAEFSWCRHGRKGIVITWASRAAPSSASATCLVPVPEAEVSS